MIQRRNIGGDIDMQRLQNLQKHVNREHSRGQSDLSPYNGARNYYGN
ncbi:MAG: hypothetical protein K2X93_12845 [Candidatus Obscuribacterales bacterium]|nr:hypothetical protein [Candidatus Obscuribacterales bacterium]